MSSYFQITLFKSFKINHLYSQRVGVGYAANGHYDTIIAKTIEPRTGIVGVGYAANGHYDRKYFQNAHNIIVGVGYAANGHYDNSSSNIIFGITVGVGYAANGHYDTNGIFMLIALSSRSGLCRQWALRREPSRWRRNRTGW